jgi:hypothetical protein
MMKHYVLILTFLSNTVFGQNALRFLKNWKSYVTPTNSDSISKYNSDPNDWVVYLEGNQVCADKTRKRLNKEGLPFRIKPAKSEGYKLRGRLSAVKVDDGYLVGFYRGEWGGNLYWFSNDGKVKYEISSHQIVQFIKRDSNIYAIEGLAHLSTSEGSIIQVEKKNYKWTVSEYQKLPSAPDAVQLDNKNNFIIVTSSSLLSIDREKHIDILIKEGFWQHYLYPSSMVIQGNVIYIGMRKGVYKFDLAKGKDEWMMPE